MPQVTVEGEKTFEVPTGKKLVLGIEDAGIDILHRCGGYSRCTTCRVEFLEGEPAEMGKEEKATLEEDGFLGQYRLSCQVRVGENDMSVKVWGRSHEKDLPPGDRPED